MAIQSHDFGGLRLSGDDASTFVRQVVRGRKNQRAAASLERGLSLVAQFDRTGRVRVNTRPKARGRTKA